MGGSNVRCNTSRVSEIPDCIIEIGSKRSATKFLISSLLAKQPGSEITLLYYEFRTIDHLGIKGNGPRFL